ncbi:oxidoreductase [Myceligenerans sp. TRM 65318]|uniref:Oxidoreductase n=2 Tax=Myceligenerans pegani TaxID=2776917 RepID=A0ABR9N0F1_9MICO|nr:oxidoreductase [Myceligenerans sp. TRM 65318]MBE3018819.1 oxidoreductase [Myceligenerans sp. TRM 65318]
MPDQPRARTAWHTATIVEKLAETPHAVRLTLAAPTWPGSEPGTHLDVRLTAPDGYQASRSYSVASSTPAGNVVLAIDELPDGEVSPFLVQDARPGDQLEIHGPLGSYFTWLPGRSDRPVQLIAGGSGVVPLYAIALAHDAAGDPAHLQLLYSVRTPAEVFFADELAALTGPTFGLDLVYTREAPHDWPDPIGRLTRETLAARTIPASQRPHIYVCGSTGFVETITPWLVDLGHSATDVLTERFGGL